MSIHKRPRPVKALRALNTLWVLSSLDRWRIDVCGRPNFVCAGRAKSLMTWMTRSALVSRTMPDITSSSKI